MGVGWEEDLAQRLHGRVVLAALGDRTAGDDAAALSLIDLLDTTTNLTLLDCGSYPQNFLGVISRDRPEVVMLVDAAELGLQPGEVRVLDRSSVTDWGGGSHGFPMELLMQQIEVLAAAQVFLLAIQVGGLTRGAPLHPDVRRAVEELAAFFRLRYPGKREG
ncbi:MAG: hydrogenase maturation protease [Candidatus Eisenbacteria bacterium]|nr:hydrogenase maturation protease [Candidatus Eisenbacteria bacterium]